MALGWSDYDTNDGSRRENLRELGDYYIIVCYYILVLFVGCGCVLLVIGSVLVRAVRRCFFVRYYCCCIPLLLLDLL